MIGRLCAWLRALLADEALARDARRHEAAADRLDMTLRELLER
jgi:hypothetical protein